MPCHSLCEDVKAEVEYQKPMTENGNPSAVADVYHLAMKCRIIGNVYHEKHEG